MMGAAPQMLALCLHHLEYNLIRADWVRKSEEKRLILDFRRFLTDHKVLDVHFCKTAIIAILALLQVS